MVAPLTEELVFRACMLPMLVPCTGPSAAVLTCPLFFGVGESPLTPLPPELTPLPLVTALALLIALPSLTALPSPLQPTSTT